MSLKTLSVGVTEAREILAGCRDASDLKEVVARGQAAAKYLRATVGAAEAATMDASEIHLWACRRLGEVLTEMDKDRGGRPAKRTPRARRGVSLGELGISYDQSARYQALSKVSKRDMTAYLKGARRNGKPPSIAGAMQYDGHRQSWSGGSTRKGEQPDPVTSVVNGNNADLIYEVARLYANADTAIADLTFGKGSFWRRCQHLDVTGSDIATVPERPYDFRETPYDDGQFDVAVLDPPYVHDGGTHVTEHRYRNRITRGMDHAAIRQLYIDGMREALRIVGPTGQIWVKCKDQVQAGKQQWAHVEMLADAESLGMVGRDLFVLLAGSETPAGRWEKQCHARKAHSYLWVFERAKQVRKRVRRGA